jgi:anti-sigma B factor antagonist
MKLKVSDHYHASVVSIGGKFLGSVDGPAFREAVSGLKEQGKTRVVIDLSATDMIDSTGIGQLISCLTTMRNAGGDVRIAALNKKIKNLFLMTRLLGPVFENFEELEEAVQSFQDRPDPASS